MRIFAIIASTSLFISIDIISKWFFSGVFQGLAFGCNNTPSLIGCNILHDKDVLFSYFPILGEVFGIQLAHNTGIAFSLPISGTFLQIITLILVMYIIVHYIRFEYPKNNTYIDIGYVLILSGALSHTYERMFVGYVVDFFSIKYFAILNFADIFISTGAILLLFIYYVSKEYKD